MPLPENPPPPDHDARALPMATFAADFRGGAARPNQPGGSYRSQTSLTTAICLALVKKLILEHVITIILDTIVFVDRRFHRPIALIEAALSV